MSVPVPVDRLAAELDRFGPSAYLLTASDDGRPHAVHVDVRLDGDALTVAVGKRTAANAAARPAVALLWVPWEAGGYNLIVDGDASLDGEAVLRVRPTKGVLHRSQAAPGSVEAGACGNDCLPLT
ncbi:MAG TPA: pyridoxamine 5'-phosphate oxidase family protein [Acidimicrobiales bacterium]